MKMSREAVTIRNIDELEALVQKVVLSDQKIKDYRGDERDLYEVNFKNGTVVIDAVSMLYPGVWAERLAMISIHMGKWEFIDSDFADFSTIIKNLAIRQDFGDSITNIKNMSYSFKEEPR